MPRAWGASSLGRGVPPKMAGQCRTMSSVPWPIKRGVPQPGAKGMLLAMSSAQQHPLQATYPYWLAGEPAAPNHDLEVRDKYSGELAARVAMADAAAIDAAIAAAVA